jgi:hypothetical protein
MREAAAEHTAKGFGDHLVRSVGLLVENCFCGQDYAAEAEATLGGALFDEGLLDRVRLLRRADTFQCRHLILANRAYWHHTRADDLAAQDNCARAALRHSATELRTAQPELIA